MKRRLTSTLAAAAWLLSACAVWDVTPGFDRKGVTMLTEWFGASFYPNRVEAFAYHEASETAWFTLCRSFSNCDLYRSGPQDANARLSPQNEATVSVEKVSVSESARWLATVTRQRNVAVDSDRFTDEISLEDRITGEKRRRQVNAIVSTIAVYDDGTALYSVADEAERIDCMPGECRLQYTKQSIVVWPHDREPLTIDTSIQDNSGNFDFSEIEGCDASLLKTVVETTFTYHVLERSNVRSSRHRSIAEAKAWLADARPDCVRGFDAAAARLETWRFVTGEFVKTLSWSSDIRPNGATAWLAPVLLSPFHVSDERFVLQFARQLDDGWSPPTSRPVTLNRAVDWQGKPRQVVGLDARAG